MRFTHGRVALCQIAAVPILAADRPNPRQATDMTAPATARALPIWQTTVFIIVCGCLISTISFGLRASYGLFVEPLGDAHGWGREVFAFAIALQNLMWGVGQPFAGAIADRYGTARVLAVGGILYGAGVMLTAYSTTPTEITMAAGLLVGLGLSGSAFGIVLAAFTKLVPEERRSWALGIGTAAGSLGQFIFAPLGQAFIGAYGWQQALVLIGGFAFLIPLLAIPLRSKARGAQPEMSSEPSLPFTAAMRQAFGHTSYLLLVAGFFVCGWQIAFITVHMPAYLSDLDIPATTAAWTIAVIGIFNVIGSYSAGILGGRFPKRYLLSALYLLRSLFIIAFLMVPVSTFTVYAFGAAMGLLWLSTVPLTSGLVAVMFGTRYMGTLFGVVFMSHQIGSFLGVWLGGVAYDTYGSYDPIWWISIALGIFAALVHMPISERQAPKLAGATA